MQQVRIDFDNPGLPQSLGVVEGESQSRIFQAALYKSGAAYTAPAGAVYSIMYRGFGPQNQGWYDTIEDGAGKRAACTVSGNVVTCELARQALRVPGHLTVVLCVSDAKGYMLKSWPIMADARNDGYEDTGEIEMYFNLSGLAGNYLTQLEKAMADAETTKNNLTSTATQVKKDIDAKAAAALESIPESYAELDGSVKQLKEDFDEQIGSQKLNGYFNLSRLENAKIYKGKRIVRFDVNTWEPVLADYESYTTVIMPIDKSFGNYNMLIGENHPSSGIAMMRYKKGSVASAVSYSQLNNLPWDANFDSSKNTLSYFTIKIIESGSQVDTYAFCFYNTEPIVYPDAFPELNSGVLQLLKIIGKEQLTDDLQNTITNISNSLSVDIMLPDTIYSVVGHEHNIYFWNTIKCSNIHDYTIRVSGANYESGIKNLGDCVRMKPTAAKNQVLSFKVYKNDALLREKSTTIKMIADNKPSARKVIFIGDSMVENGYEIAELKNMFGEDMTFYGTRQGGQRDSGDTWQTVYHEGRSSWDSGEYLNSASKNNVANAFYNSSVSKFDFSYYMNNNTSFNDVTDVFIQLGNNDADKMTKEQYVSNIQYIIDDIHKYNSNIKVFVCVPSPVVNDGYAYGIRNYVDVQYSKNHLFECGKHLMENVKNAICVPIYQNLDCYNDFPKSEVAFSARNPDKHTVCNDNVHPSKYGFYKFADTLYCAILGAYTN